MAFKGDIRVMTPVGIHKINSVIRIVPRLRKTTLQRFKWMGATLK